MGRLTRRTNCFVHRVIVGGNDLLHLRSSELRLIQKFCIKFDTGRYFALRYI